MKTYTPKEIMRILIEKGFILKRVKGSHHIFYNIQTNKTVIVPLHQQDLPIGTGSINRKSFAWIILLIALIYIPYGFFVAERFDQFGVYISSSYTGGLEYLIKTMHINPKGLNLQSSYEDCGKALSGSDAGEYIRGGMGIADGKGISIKCLECKPAKYSPYTFRPPATSMAIALIATIFGKEHVYPYFIFTLILQFLCSVMIILSATRFVKSNWGLFSVGLLSIFCPPITNLHYGLGLFLAIAFYFLGKFWDIAQENKLTLKSIIYIILFSSSMGLASYFRDIYGALLVFICLVIGVYFLIKSKYYFKISKVAIHFLIDKRYFKTIAVFIRSCLKIKD
jgi:predicted RNA binding protein YcfA (HicA-like mRNA interferase family)